MERRTVAGPSSVEPMMGGEEGDVLIVISPQENVRIEIPMSRTFLDEFLIPRLQMDRDELIKTLEGEREEAEAEVKRQVAAQRLAMPHPN